MDRLFFLFSCALSLESPFFSSNASRIRSSFTLSSRDLQLHFQFSDQKRDEKSEHSVSFPTSCARCRPFKDGEAIDASWILFQERGPCARVVVVPSDIECPAPNWRECIQAFKLSGTLQLQQPCKWRQGHSSKGKPAGQLVE